MATLSFYLVVAGAIALVGAFALYVVHLVLVAQGDRAITPRLATAAASMRGNLAEQLDGGAPTPAESSSPISGIAGALAIAATSSLGVALIARAIVVGRGPWGNLYEFTISFAFGICAAAIVFDRKQRFTALSTIAYGIGLHCSPMQQHCRMRWLTWCPHCNIHCCSPSMSAWRC